MATSQSNNCLTYLHRVESHQSLDQEPIPESWLLRRHIRRRTANADNLARRVLVRDTPDVDMRRILSLPELHEMGVVVANGQCLQKLVIAAATSASTQGRILQRNQLTWPMRCSFVSRC